MSDFHNQHQRHQQNLSNRNNSQRQNHQNSNNGSQPVIPAGKDIQKIFNGNGNFSLWYNKYTPIVNIGNKKNELHTCNKNGESSEAVAYYKEQYSNYSKAINEKLKMLHDNQRNYLLSFPEQDYEVIELKAKTKSPLITGIGQTHPAETSMVFDYMLGIPYIPASSIKGLLRFSTIINEINNNPEKYNNNEKQKIDDETIEAVLYYFGGQQERGALVILDAYPERVPELHIDIMNPHYTKYYQDAEAPGDYLTPTPIKFLTVKPGTVFIFRILAEKKTNDIDVIKNILTNALTQEGVGAKTSLGYGLFHELQEKDLDNERKKMIQQEKEETAKRALESMNEVDRLCYTISQYTEPSNTSEYNYVADIIKNIQNYSEQEKIKIAKTIKEYYIRINKWEKQKAKQGTRVSMIKEILGET